MRLEELLARPPECVPTPLRDAIRRLKMARPLRGLATVKTVVARHLLRKMKAARIAAGDRNGVVVVRGRGAP